MCGACGYGKINSVLSLNSLLLTHSPLPPLFFDHSLFTTHEKRTSFSYSWFIIIYSDWTFLLHSFRMFHSNIASLGNFRFFSLHASHQFLSNRQPTEKNYYESKEDKLPNCFISKIKLIIDENWKIIHSLKSLSPNKWERIKCRKTETKQKLYFVFCVFQ